MGFDVSYQKVGINRCGEFMKPCRTKGPVRDQRAVHGDKSVPATCKNEPWRRISDLVGANAETMDPKVRRRCVKKLAAWIDRKVSEDRAKLEQRALKIPNLTEAWGEDISEWRRVSRAGIPVEGVCARLGISRAKLTSLLKETLGLSAGELLDGFKIRGLRKHLIGQLREAAFGLWGAAGEFAKRRCMKSSGPEGSQYDPPLSPLMKGGKTAGALRARGRLEAGATAGRMPALRKRSKYFRTQAHEFWGLEEFEEEQIRLSELLGRLDFLREENDWRLETFVTLLGFESVRNFRRACLNVMGRTLEQLERILAREVVAYYLAAEEREMREICLREDEFGFRAREIYCGDGEKIPSQPFCDRWSACEFAKPEWLKLMIADFGLGNAD